MPMLTPYVSPFSNSLVLIIASGVLALLSAAIFRAVIATKGTGTEKMEAIARQIRLGAMAFLKREYGVIFLFVVVVGALIYTFPNTKLYPSKLGMYPAINTMMCRKKSI